MHQINHLNHLKLESKGAYNTYSEIKFKTKM